MSVVSHLSTSHQWRPPIIPRELIHWDSPLLNQKLDSLQLQFMQYQQSTFLVCQQKIVCKALE